MCKGKEQPEPEKKRDLSLSMVTVTLTETNVASLVTLKSTDDWKSDLKISVPKANAVLPVSVGEKHWLKITPAMGKAGITNLNVSLIKEKLPKSAASMDVKFVSLDGTLSKTLTVKYEPKK